jgi:Zn-dependent protease
MSVNNIAQGLTFFIAMLFALTFHESAHALASHLLGDNTAKAQGRLSLNPAVHIDLMGTIILPLACSLFGMPFFGWAKPVPYNERNFKHPARDSMLTASAGPVANLVLGFLCMVFVLLNHRYQWSLFEAGTLFAPIIKLAAVMIQVNGMLAFLNLIPLPPLDGATIMRAFVNRDFWDRYEAVVAPYGFFIFLFLAFSGGLTWISYVTRYYIDSMEFLVRFLLPGIV